MSTHYALNSQYIYPAKGEPCRRMQVALLRYGFGHVTTGLGTWRAHGYLVALLPLSLFFRFDVLVT
jgi:hypothetical protein